MHNSPWGQKSDEKRCCCPFRNITYLMQNILLCHLDYINVEV